VFHRLLRFLIVVSLTLWAWPNSNVSAQPPLFPWPAKYQEYTGVAVVSASSEVQVAQASLQPLARQLAADLLRIAGSSQPAQVGVPITLALSGAADLGTEGYDLEISSRSVKIVAHDLAAVFYGTRSLLQLLTVGKGRWILKAARIGDHPRFAYRGMHLDVARHFFSVNEIEAYLELLATYKLNVFHWHLTDDQGWRLEVPSRPRLTQFAAFREDRRHERFPLPAELRAPLPAGSAPYGGFYTADDVKRVVAFAAARFITVIPELDWPGHSQAAMAAYPQLSCVQGKQYQVAPGAVYPFSDPLCPCKPESMAFVNDVLDVVVRLFPGPWIHIGGDELNTASWNTPICDAYQKAHGLADAKALATYFVSAVAASVQSRGKTPIVWEESASQATPPSGALTMLWKSDALLAPLANAGRKVVSANSASFYFDLGNADSGPGYAGFLRVLDHNLFPPRLSLAAQENLVGVQGALWTESLQTYAQVERAVLPRLAALSEVAWGASAGSRRSSLQRLRSHLPWLTGLGHNVFVPGPVGLPTRKVFLKETLLDLRAPEPGFEVRYTLDGSDPLAASPIAPKKLAIRNSCTVKARTFLSGTNVASETVTGTFSRDLPAKAASKGELLPGLTWTYHPGRTIDARRAATNAAAKQGVIDLPRVPDEFRGQNAFGLRFLGLVKVAKTGVHTFCTTSNDGSVLFINGQAVVENDLIHNERTRCGEVALAAGYHQITVLYFEDFGAESLSVSYGFGTKLPQLLPASAYAHEVSR